MPRLLRHAGNRPQPSPPGECKGDARAALSRPSGLGFERITLGVLDRVDGQIDVEVGPTKVSRRRPLKAEDRLDRGALEPREIFERQEQSRVRRAAARSRAWKCIVLQVSKCSCQASRISCSLSTTRLGSRLTWPAPLLKPPCCLLLARSGRPTGERSLLDLPRRGSGHGSLESIAYRAHPARTAEPVHLAANA